jgi:hypothetical protein
MKSRRNLKLVQKAKFILMFQTISLQNVVNFGHREVHRFEFQILEVWKYLEKSKCSWGPPVTQSGRLTACTSHPSVRMTPQTVMPRWPYTTGGHHLHVGMAISTHETTQAKIFSILDFVHALARHHLAPPLLCSIAAAHRWLAAVLLHHYLIPLALRVASYSRSDFAQFCSLGPFHLSSRRSRTDELHPPLVSARTDGFLWPQDVAWWSLWSSAAQEPSLGAVRPRVQLVHLDVDRRRLAENITSEYHIPDQLKQVLV